MYVSSNYSIMNPIKIYTICTYIHIYKRTYAQTHTHTPTHTHIHACTHTQDNNTFSCMVINAFSMIAESGILSPVDVSVSRWSDASHTASALSDHAFRSSSLNSDHFWATTQFRSFRSTHKIQNPEYNTSIQT